MNRIVLEPLEKSTIAKWFESDTGRYTLAWERTQIDLAVEDVFGFNAVQLGAPGIDFLKANRMPSRFSVGPEPGCTVRADFTHLPLASQSVDLIVLPHVLEFCKDPHQVLREAERVLMPDGQIVIAGFNPISLWGMSKWVAGRRQEWPWRGEFIGLRRLRDWLKLLGFELNGGKFGGYAPPFKSEKWLRRFRFMEAVGDRWWPIVGGLYVVRAIKRTAGMRLVTPAWRTRRSQPRALTAVTQRGTWGKNIQSKDPSSPTLRLITGGGLPAVGAAVPTPMPSAARNDDADA